MGLRNELYAVFKGSVVSADNLANFNVFLIGRCKEVMNSELAYHCPNKSTEEAVTQTFFHSNLPGEPEEVEDRRKDQTYQHHIPQKIVAHGNC